MKLLTIDFYLIFHSIFQTADLEKDPIHAKKVEVRVAIKITKKVKVKNRKVKRKVDPFHRNLRILPDPDQIRIQIQNPQQVIPDPIQMDLKEKETNLENPVKIANHHAKNPNQKIGKNPRKTIDLTVQIIKNIENRHPSLRIRTKTGKKAVQNAMKIQRILNQIHLPGIHTVA